MDRDCSSQSIALEEVDGDKSDISSDYMLVEHYGTIKSSSKQEKAERHQRQAQFAVDNGEACLDGTSTLRMYANIVLQPSRSRTISSTYWKSFAILTSANYENQSHHRRAQIN